MTLKNFQSGLPAVKVISWDILESGWGGGMGLYSISKGGIGAGEVVQLLGVFAAVLEKFDSQHPCPVAYNRL